MTWSGPVSGHLNCYPAGSYGGGGLLQACQARGQRRRSRTRCRMRPAMLAELARVAWPRCQGVRSAVLFPGVSDRHIGNNHGPTSGSAFWDGRTPGQQELRTGVELASSDLSSCHSGAGRNPLSHDAEAGREPMPRAPNRRRHRAHIARTPPSGSVRHGPLTPLHQPRCFAAVRGRPQRCVSKADGPAHRCEAHRGGARRRTIPSCGVPSATSMTRRQERRHVASGVDSRRSTSTCIDQVECPGRPWLVPATSMTADGVRRSLLDGTRPRPASACSWSR